MLQHNANVSTKLLQTITGNDNYWITIETEKGKVHINVGAKTYNAINEAIGLTGAPIAGSEEKENKRGAASMTRGKGNVIDNKTKK